MTCIMIMKNGNEYTMNYSATEVAHDVDLGKKDGGLTSLTLAPSGERGTTDMHVDPNEVSEILPWPY